MRLTLFAVYVFAQSGKTVGGGDNTRKQKLLQKQKDGKKRMKHFGKIPLSKDVFLAVLKK